MGEDLEGNHFQVMEDAHQGMKDLIVSFFSDALPEVGKGSFLHIPSGVDRNEAFPEDML